MSSYTIVDVPSRWIVGTREVISTAEMVVFYDRVYSDAAHRVAEVGGTIVGPGVAYYFTPLTDTVDILAGFPVNGEVAARTSKAVQFPQTRAARYIHRGGYDDLPRAWKDFVEDLVADGYSIPAEPCWEEYTTEPTPETPVDELVTELYCPIS